KMQHSETVRKWSSATVIGVDHLVAHVRVHWPLWTASGLVAVALVIGFRTGLELLAVRWDYPYNHSYLVVGMSVYLLVTTLRRASIGYLGPSWMGLLAVPVVVLLYALFEIMDFSLGMH